MNLFLQRFGSALMRHFGVVDKNVRKENPYNPRMYWPRDFANRVNRRRAKNKMAARSRRINRLRKA